MSGSRSRSNYIVAIFQVILVVGLFEEHKKQILNGERFLSDVLTVMALLIFMALIYKAYRRLIKWRRLHDPNMAAIDKMSGLDFEKCIARLLSLRGYKYVTLTEKYDFGIDIVAEKDGVRWGVQVKRRNGLVKANAVRQVVTALKKYNCTRAMVVTNGRYSKVASELAKSNDCELVGRNELYRWFPVRKAEYSKSLRPGL